MLTAILERGSWVIAKLGMPLVLLYHLIISSVFLNTAASDATGLEKWANTALVPFHYYFEGKLATRRGDGEYVLERRFSYNKYFFTRTACSAAALPISLAVGSTLKGLAHFSHDVRTRGARIKQAYERVEIVSNTALYSEMGIDLIPFHAGNEIAPPKWKRHPDANNRLVEDVKALKEMTKILSKYGIPFWLDCGSCLGCYQYGGAIPNDWDIDIAVLLPDFHNVKSALRELDPDHFVVQDWSGRARPASYLKVFVKASGGMIDIYHFALDKEKGELRTLLSNEFNIFLPQDWKIREKRYCTPMPLDYVFPLKKGYYEGIEIPMPNKTEEYLHVFYGESLAPARVYNEVTGNYEKDENHPYWKLPHAH